MIPKNFFSALFRQDALAGLEDEKRALVSKSVSLEKSFARREITKREHMEMKAAVHKKMVLLDLEISIKKAEKSFGENLKEIMGLGWPDAAVLAGKKTRIAGEFSAAKGLFRKKRINVGEFEKALRKVHSAVLDAEHELSLEKRKAKKEMAGRIMEQTRAKLLETQTNAMDAKEGQGRENVIVVPEKENTRLHHPSTRKQKFA